ncbi:tRNA dihydrouridine(20/20a) synthase DusA [bacterium SCSIO 12696]|nr:tRNA dihydrouridine(20/20a) synthase DusA [bacterium SCSIO 12696]
MPENTTLNRRFSVAPMLDWTDRYCRYFLRLLSKHALLYTEMVNSGTIKYGDRDHHLGFDPSEHPLALQLGGSDPTELAEACKIAEQYSYDEINLNCGCPSDRVQKGRFGACLMAEPNLVVDCIRAMQDACDLPVTIKSRIGIDELDNYQNLLDFVGPIQEAGCVTFIVHARKAWLQGLSPKQNREIPPLDYPRVYRLKKDFPHLEIIINGGITSLDQAEEHLRHVDGVMVGREVYHNPYILAEVDQRLFGDNHPIPSREQVYEQFVDYVEQQLLQGVKLSHMSRHILGLFQGMHGGRKFRRYISEHAYKPGAGTDVLRNALDQLNTKPMSM